MIECPVCHDGFNSVQEFNAHIQHTPKQTSDYETPLMRDIEKVLPRYVLGLLIGLGIVFLFVFPFSLSVYGQHCIETTGYTIPQWIIRSLTIQC